MAALLTLPAVDGVEITTIMDNSFDGLLSSTSVARRFPIAHYGFLEHRSRNEREGLIDQEEYDVHKKQGTITGCSSE